MNTFLQKLYVSPKHFVLIIFFGVFFTLTLFFIYSRTTISDIQNKFYRNDFVQFYTGAVIANTDLSKLYDHQTQVEVQSTYFGIFDRSFRSLPFVAIMLQPLALTTPIVAQNIMLGIMLIAFFITIRFYSYSTKDFLYKGIIAFSYYPFAIAMYNTQISILVAAGVGAGILLLKKNKALTAGLVLSTVLLKPQFMLLPLLLTISTKSKMRYLVGLGIGCIGLLSVGITKLGASYPLKYLTFLTETETEFFGTNKFELSSFQSLFAHINYDLAGRLTVYTVIILLLTVIPLYIKLSSKFSLTEQILIAMLSTLALSLHAFVFDSLMLIFPIFMLYEDKKFNLSKILYLLPFTTLLGLNPIHPIGYLAIIGYLLFSKAKAQI